MGTKDRRRPTDLNLGGSNIYDQTNRLTLSVLEKAQGWEITKCITCNGRGRRGNGPCNLCRGERYIKTLNPEKHRAHLRQQAALRAAREAGTAPPPRVRIRKAK